MRHENIWDFIKAVKIGRSLQWGALTVSYTLSPDWSEKQDELISLSNYALQFCGVFCSPGAEKNTSLNN